MIFRRNMEDIMNFKFDSVDLEDIEIASNIDLEGKKIKVGYSKRISQNGQEDFMFETLDFV